jgi:probable rRNA maturation factor
MASKPTLRLYNHHPTIKGAKAALSLWRRVARNALPKAMAEATSPDAPLLHLEEVEISFVDDDAIAAVHGDFMNDPTPTDVITFHHGEVIISLDTAKRQGAEHGQPWEKETALYVIHGLLHLAGWDDLEEEERKRMHAVQERILGEVWGD